VSSAERPKQTKRNTVPKHGTDPKRSTLRRGLVTTELLDKATSLFATKGFESTSLQDIADAVGVSRPAIYHYVSNKEDLLAMLVEQVSQALAQVLADLAGRGDLSPTEKLRILTRLLVEQRAAHPDQFRILDRSENVLPSPAREQHTQARRDILAKLVVIIDEGVACGEFRSVDTRTAALSILGMCNWVAWWFRSDSDSTQVAQTITHFAELMLVQGGPEDPSSEPLALLNGIRNRVDQLEVTMRGGRRP
jgi:AcrR family transcriptional regulator